MLPKEKYTVDITKVIFIFIFTDAISFLLHKIGKSWDLYTDKTQSYNIFVKKNIYRTLKKNSYTTQEEQ